MICLKFSKILIFKMCLRKKISNFEIYIFYLFPFNFKISRKNPIDSCSNLLVQHCVVKKYPKPPFYPQRNERGIGCTEKWKYFKPLKTLLIFIECFLCVASEFCRWHQQHKRWLKWVVKTKGKNYLTMTTQRHKNNRET